MTTDKFTMMDSLNNALNVNNKPEKVNELETITEPKKEVTVKTTAEKNADEDYEYTRKKLKNLVEAGEDAIENFKEVCAEGEEPRAYEVLATLIKNTGDLAKSVLETSKIKSAIDKERRTIDKPDVGEGGTYTQTNQTVIFAGSTKELLDMINAEKNKVIDAETIEES